MSIPPHRSRGTMGARDVAEAAFKSATTKPIQPIEPAAKKPSLPNAKELVSLRIDQDVLEHFQAGGPGWQDRINEALRKAAGK
ncbi:MAG: BrnA antitoxin family protein [Hyphomicrobiales bacterium]